MPDLSSDPQTFRQEPGWAAVAEIAERQWGVVSVRELQAAGVTPGAVKHQVATGRLRRLHRGVYAFGHAQLRPEGHWLAAVRACGPAAVLSHASAAALWGFRPTSAARVDVTAPERLRARAGIRIHESRCLLPGDLGEQAGIPVTAIARTLLDLAGTLSVGDLEATVARARQMPDFDAAALADVIARGHGHRGAGRLAKVVAIEPKLTRSELERLFLALVRRGGLPEPETNVWLTLGAGEEVEVDVLWRAQRVSVELDGWRFHRDRRSFEDDRARAATMTAAGYRHVQLTWRRLTGDPDGVLRTLHLLLRS